MNTVSIIILTIIITIGALMIGKTIYDYRKTSKGIPWDRVRPIVTEVFTEAIKIQKIDKLGYDAVEKYAVSFVKVKIDESNFFAPEEKAMLTENLIRSIIGPKLKELYDKG